MKLKNDKTLNIALTAVFACIVFVLSYLGSFVHIGAISFALTLIPIVLGGIYIGPWAGAFLGAVFGLTVLFTDVTALALLSINWFYAFLGCVVRGVIAGSSTDKVMFFSTVALPYCFVTCFSSIMHQFLLKKYCDTYCFLQFPMLK